MTRVRTTALFRCISWVSFVSLAGGRIRRSARMAAPAADLVLSGHPY